MTFFCSYSIIFRKRSECLYYLENFFVFHKHILQSSVDILFLFSWWLHLQFVIHTFLCGEKTMLHVSLFSSVFKWNLFTSAKLSTFNFKWYLNLFFTIACFTFPRVLFICFFVFLKKILIFMENRLNIFTEIFHQKSLFIWVYLSLHFHIL